MNKAPLSPRPFPHWMEKGEKSYFLARPLFLRDGVGHVRNELAGMRGIGADVAGWVG